MRIRDLCRERRVVRANLKTPALVPSFSSRGFPKVADMHHHLKEYTTDSSLVSAFDIAYGSLREPDIYCSEILFIDSGGYETGTNSDLSDSYHAGAQKQDWTESLHLAAVQSLQPLSRSRMVLVNYDESLPYSEQLKRARAFFGLFASHASDFLLKPPADTSIVDLDELTRYASDLAEFNIVGITEKELGASFLDRCENLVRLRKALHEQKADTPIHVFGSLDPLSVLAYFLCGADIFDGLSWLRYAYKDGVAVYFNSYSITEEQWSTDFESVKMASAVYNLGHLRRLQVDLRTFVKSYDWKAFNLNQHYMTQVKKLIKAAGVEF